MARELSPNDPASAAVAAGRLTAQKRRAAITAGETLVQETTLSGRDTLRLMRSAREAGYRVELHYVRLQSAEASLRRVRCRVRAGGHDVPEAEGG